MWKRIIVTAAGAVMNLVLGFIVLVIVVCLQGQIVSRTIYGFQENAASQQCGLQQGDTIVAVNGRRCYIANDISYELRALPMAQRTLRWNAMARQCSWKTCVSTVIR